MLLLPSRMATLVRPLHTAPVTFQFVKDIYKTVNFKTSYSDEEKEGILHKLNKLSEADLHSYISKKMSKTIIQHRQKSGNFDCVEQLLDLPKMDPKIVQKVCLGLLKSGEELKNQEEVDKRKKQSLMFSRDIIPKPDIRLFTEHFLSSPTVVGVSINLKRISYAKVEFPSGRLIDWSLDIPSIPLQELTGSTPYQHHSLHKTVSEAMDGGIVEDRRFDGLPEGDYYLIEEMLPILPKDASLKAKISLLRLRHTFLAILMERKQKSEVHTIKPSVIDQIFNLKIGSERRSMKIDFHGLIQTGDEEGNFKVDIEEEHWDYYGASDSHGKETLLSCVAQALAFHHLCCVKEDLD